MKKCEIGRNKREMEKRYKYVVENIIIICCLCWLKRINNRNKTLFS